MKFKKYVSSRLGAVTIIALLGIIATLALLANILDETIGTGNKIYWMLILSGFLSTLAVALIVETFRDLYNQGKASFLDKIKHMKIFEFGFFLFLFFATLCATVSVSLRLSHLYWLFTIFYAIAISCGIYHYLVRLDDR